MRRGGGASELDDSAGSDLPPGLKAMRNENVLLTLPGNYKVRTVAKKMRRHIFSQVFGVLSQKFD